MIRARLRKRRTKPVALFRATPPESLPYAANRSHDTEWRFSESISRSARRSVCVRATTKLWPMWPWALSAAAVYDANAHYATVSYKPIRAPAPIVAFLSSFIYGETARTAAIIRFLSLFLPDLLLQISTWPVSDLGGFPASPKQVVYTFLWPNLLGQKKPLRVELT